ncbi:MAG: sigma-70 family RNA polymerase sigma factor [Candidatus Krumholzibacteria bacterium]|nr:sigma-70 family RNA polymerase sigma factor [Candidatus Krumholzibacteria bacterium]
MTPRFGKPDPRGKSHRAGDRQDESRIQEDLVLIEHVLAGSTAHWHTFVDRYSGLIYSVARRQLFAEDEDDVRTVFVDVLEALYRGKLGEFRGRSKLSTWLIVVARGFALDFLRRRDGRRKLPKDHDQLTPFEQEIFRLHYGEGLGFEAVIHTLASMGQKATADQIARAVLRIESLFDARYLRRLEYDARAPSLGIASGRLLDFLMRTDMARESALEETPEHAMDRARIEEEAARARALLETLGGEEREVVRLRYEEGWTAKRISDELGLGGQRRVYTILDRVLRRLRKLMRDQ